MEKISYALGMVIGHNLKGMNVAGLAATDFAQGVSDVLSGAAPALSDDEARRLVNEYLQEREAARAAAARKEGEDFLAANGRKEGVNVLPSGLQYQVLAEGTGRRPGPADHVKCHYEGTLPDGTVFDSSYRRGEPATFPLGGVIKGWTEGLQLMKEGAKYRFFIPYQLGYGARGAGQDIPPYAALVFDVELLQVL